MKRFLFLAEKPSLMRDIKSTYLKHKKDVENSVGKIDFIALAGHACRYLEPREYPEWDDKWSNIDLPMIPTVYKIDKIPGMERFIKEIRTAMKNVNYDGVIVGTDADIEGNGIYYLLSNYLGLTKIPAFRFYLDDQTDKGIYKALLSLTDYYTNPRDVHMTESYLIRSHLDWLIGMNFTIGTSVKSGFTTKVGRVKTPTLKLVYDNCEAIKKFIPHSDFAVNANFIDGFLGTLVELEMDGDEKKAKPVYNQKRLETKEAAELLIKSLPLEGNVILHDKKKQKIKAPLLYSLSDLQIEADAKYHYDPTKVLEIVQSLYETHKIVSYPRTSGNYISESKAEDFSNFIKACSYIPGLDIYTSKISSADIARVKTDKNIVNDKEVAKASHDALMPTGKIPELSGLSVEELNICMMIYKRFLAHFLPVLEEEKSIILVDVNGSTFKANGKKVICAGWTAIFDKRLEETIIPDYHNGDIVGIKGFDAAEKITQPPKRFGQGTLVNAMRNAARYIEDKELRKALREAEGLGQPSSRHKIISDLIHDGYIEERKSGLYMTEAGNRYIEVLKDYSITSPELASIWEYKTNQIRQGVVRYEDVEREMIEYIKNTIKEIENLSIEKSDWLDSGLTKYICPVCKKHPLLKGRFGWYCEGKKDKSCYFQISATIAKKKITESNVKQLVEKGVTNELKGFQSSAGKLFSARLKRNGEKIEFLFSESKPKVTKDIYQCPCCGLEIISDKWAWKCQGSCGFALNYKLAGKELTEANLKELILKKKTKKITGFMSKTGKRFSASIKLNADGTIGFEF